MIKMGVEYFESDSVRLIPKVGPVVQTSLLKLGLDTLHNVLEWYPRHYLDASHPTPLDSLPIGQLVTIKGTIQNSKQIRLRGKISSIVEATIGDDTAELRLRWFNQPFMLQKLVVGSEWLCIGQVSIGKGSQAMINPLLEVEARILPVYAQTAGVTSKSLREYTRWSLEHVTLDSAYELPEEIRVSEQLLSRVEALRCLHRPETMQDVEIGRQTAGFAEAFWFFVRSSASRSMTSTERATPIPIDPEYLHQLTELLPFSLTDGQKRSLWEIVQDMAKNQPMTRLLNGEVGSGKTAVAGIAAAAVAKAGYRTVLLAPTAILALQHTESLAKLLGPMGITVGCWTAKRKDNLEQANLIIGTHALLQEGVVLPKIGLVIIDEQHRFGVRQRQLLRERGVGEVPHLLSMTATPIPRSLALALFSDLKMSVIPQKPADRLPVETRVVHQPQRVVMHERILVELAQGHQAFVICPLIEEGEIDSSSSLQEGKKVTQEVERLRRENPEYGAIGMLHGRMKEAEKRAVMEQMAAGEIQVLVATSVVEVGIDIPTATVMVIEGAERFGLSQLHQFRGRVGRSDLPSYCFLCPSIRSPGIERRLNVLVDHQSGFEIAEQDLAERGPGDLGGLVQSGLPEFKTISLGDFSYLRHVKEIVANYLIEHPEFLERYKKLSAISLE